MREERWRSRKPGAAAARPQHQCCRWRPEGSRPMVTDTNVLIWEQAELIESLQLELDRNNRDRTLQRRVLCRPTPISTRAAQAAAAAANREEA